MITALIVLACIAGYIGMAGLTYRHAFIRQFRGNKARWRRDDATIKGYATSEASFMALLWPLTGTWMLFTHVFTPPADALLTDAEKVAKLSAEIERLEREAGIR